MCHYQRYDSFWLSHNSLQANKDLPVFIPSYFQCCFLLLAYEPRHDKTNKVSVHPAKTQISLGIRPVWSEFSLSAWRKLGPLATQWAHSQDSDQTGRMPRLIWVFAGRTLTLLVLSCRGSYCADGFRLCYFICDHWQHVLQILLNPHLPSGPVHPYQLDKSISCFRDVWCAFFHFYSISNIYSC